MTLTEILRERVSRRGMTAQVSCGALGTVTVEALPAGEYAALLRGPNGPKAVFYAACRELQAAGEELQRAGRLYQPDEIMDFLSDEEVSAAVNAIVELSFPLGAPQAEVDAAGSSSISRSAAVQAGTVPDLSDGSGARSLYGGNTEVRDAASPLPDSGTERDASGFSADEAALACRVARHIADGLRQAAAVR